MSELPITKPGADGGVALPQPCSARCQECDGTGIVGDEGPGRKNARHEWYPCDCPKGDEHRPRRMERYHPEWTDAEMDAISGLAKAKEMSQKNIIRQAVRLYQAAAFGGCTVVWPSLQQNDKPSHEEGGKEQL